MLGVFFHYLPSTVIKNVLMFIFLTAVLYINSDIDINMIVQNSNIFTILDLPSNLFNELLGTIHPYEYLFYLIFFLLNLSIALIIEIEYRYASMPYSLNLAHMIKDLSKDNTQQISVLDRFKSKTSDNTLIFKNRIAIDKSRYENKIESIREFLEIPKDSEIIVEQLSNKTIALHIKHISSYIELDKDKIIEDKIYLGKTYNDKDFYLNFNELTHTLTVGESGSGKSTLLNLFILSILKNISFVDKLYCIDFKGPELYRYASLEKVEFIDKMDSLIAMLEDITNIMNDRYGILKEQGELKYKGNSIFVIIDEVGTIGTYHDKKVRDKAFALLTNLLQKARASNIYFLIFAQKIEISVLPTAITSNIQSKILMKTDNDYNIQQTIGKENLLKITNVEASDFPRGRGVFKDGISSEKVVFQVPYFDKDLFRKFI